MSRQVMLSYSRKDEAIVHKFHERLVANQIQTWVDWKDILPGFSWRQALYDGVLESDTIIIFLSNAYIASEMCRMECYLARVNNKQILPVWLENPFEATHLFSQYVEIDGIQYLSWRAYGTGNIDGVVVDDEESFASVLKAINQDFTLIPSEFIYIAHSRSQMQFAEKLAKDLQAANIPVWAYTGMFDIGTNWLDSTWIALRQAKGIVPILDIQTVKNGDSTVSAHLKREILVARTRHLPTFPIIVKEVAQDSDKIKSLRQVLDESYEMRLLSEIQWLMPMPDYDTMLSKLISALNRILNFE